MPEATRSSVCISVLVPVGRDPQKGASGGMQARVYHTAGEQGSPGWGAAAGPWRDLVGAWRSSGGCQDEPAKKGAGQAVGWRMRMGLRGSWGRMAEQGVWGLEPGSPTSLWQVPGNSAVLEGGCTGTAGRGLKG